MVRAFPVLPIVDFTFMAKINYILVGKLLARPGLAKYERGNLQNCMLTTMKRPRKGFCRIQACTFCCTNDQCSNEGINYDFDEGGLLC